MASDSSAEIAGGHRRSTVCDLFQPDLSRRRRTHAPEERLMIAVLHDAIDCIEKYRFATERQGRRVFHEAKR